MSLANPLLGAPRIHGELLKLGIDVGQTSVAKYLAIAEHHLRKGGERFCVIMPMASRFRPQTLRALEIALDFLRTKKFVARSYPQPLTSEVVAVS